MTFINSSLIINIPIILLGERNQPEPQHNGYQAQTEDIDDGGEYGRQLSNSKFINDDQIDDQEYHSNENG